MLTSKTLTRCDNDYFSSNSRTHGIQSGNWKFSEQKGDVRIKEWMSRCSWVKHCRVGNRDSISFTALSNINFTDWTLDRWFSYFQQHCSIFICIEASISVKGKSYLHMLALGWNWIKLQIIYLMSGKLLS